MRRSPALLLSLAVMALAAWAVLAARAWPWKAALFPLVIGVPVFLLALVEFCWTAVGPAGAPPQVVDFAVSEPVDRSTARRRTAATFAWLGGFLVLVVALGVPVAVPVFVGLYLRLQGGEGWAVSLTLGAVAGGFVYGLFVRLLHLPFADGWLLGGLQALGVLG